MIGEVLIFNTMKTILVMTDFTENAAHAALSGVMLSEKIHANMLLLNVNITQPVLPQYAGGPTVVDDFRFWEDESKEMLHKLSTSLEPLLTEPERGMLKPSIHVEYAEGNVGDMVKEAIKQRDIELIVMGARAGSTMEHILTGSDTTKVIDNATRPVLVIPQNADLNKLAKVIFATDYNEKDIKGIYYLTKLGRIFNFHLEIIHVESFGENDITKTLREITFLRQLHKLKYPNMTIKEVQGKDIVHRLNTLFEESGADLLSMTHYNNSFFTRIFKQSVTRKALADQKVPLLVFPSVMQEK